MIIQSYLVREILRPFLTIVGTLGLVFIGYRSAVALNDVVAGLLPAATIMRFVLIKGLIALEVLLPVALYLSVVVGLGRLHADSEMVALSAVGYSELDVLKVVFVLGLVTALLVAGLSLLARPWAYHQSYVIKAIAEISFDIGDLESRRFYVGPESRYALYAEAVVPQERRAQSVMFQIRDGEERRIILADEMTQPARSLDDPVTFEFFRGRAYRMGREDNPDLSLRFERLVWRLAGPDMKGLVGKSKTRSTADLRGSKYRKDLAEYQWRLSTPITSLLLALLAVPLSRSAPRRPRYMREVVAVLAYALFYNLMSMAKNLVQEGVVGPMPGLWWPLVLLVLVTLVALLWPRCGKLGRCWKRVSTSIRSSVSGPGRGAS